MQLNHLQKRGLDLLTVFKAKDKSIGFKHLRNYHVKATKEKLFTIADEQKLKNNNLQVKQKSFKSLQSNQTIVPDSEEALTKYAYTPFVEGEDPFEHLAIVDQEGLTFPPYTQAIYESQYHPEAMAKKYPKTALKTPSTKDKRVNFATDDDDKSEASLSRDLPSNSPVSTVDAFSKMQIIDTDGIIDGESYDVRYRMAMDQSKMSVSNDGVALSYIERGGMTMGSDGSQEKVHDVLKVVVASKTVDNISTLTTSPLKILRSGQTILINVPALKNDLIELLLQADERLVGLEHIGGRETAQARSIDTALMVTRIKKHSPDYLRIVIDLPGKVRVNGKELQKDIVKLLGENCAVGEVLHVETDDESMNDGKLYTSSANGVVFYLAADRVEVIHEEEKKGVDAETIRQHLLQAQSKAIVNDLAEKLDRMSLDGKCTFE